MKKALRNYFVICIIITLECAIVNMQIILRAQNEKKETHEYSIADEEKEKSSDTEDVKEQEDGSASIIGIQENDKDNDNVENVNNEEIDPLFDSGVDIRERIDNYLGEDKGYTSFIYYNLVTGENISFNEDIYMNAASTYKLGLSVVAYNMVNNGEITLDDLVYYSPWQFQEGTGILQYDTSFGSLPLSTLLEYSVRYSDNIAATMVYTYLGGWTNYKCELFSLLGIDYGNYDNSTSARVEFEVLKYIYEHRNDTNFDILIEDMKNTDFHDRLDKYLPYDKVAHKIGSDEGFTHDIGIVFTDEPYIIIMMTDSVSNGPDKIADISKAIYLYNTGGAVEKVDSGVKPKPYVY